MNPSHIKKLESKGIQYEQDSGLLKFTEVASFVRNNGKLVSSSSRESLEVIESGNSTVSGPIYPVLHAMTADKVTANKTYYPSSELMGDEMVGTGVYSWLYPYARPVILDHNEAGGMLGGGGSPALGRIKAAGIVEGAGYLSLVAEITDPTAIEKILDERYLTVSIGVSAESCKCSICGIDQREDWCDHVKGKLYPVKQKNGSQSQEQCYYIIGGIRAREISFVNVPSDDQAQVVIKDLGAEGMKAWGKQKGIMTRTESVEEQSKDTLSDLQAALKGFWFIESKQKDNITMPTPEVKEVEAEKPTTETTEQAPATETNNESITEFNSLEEILTELSELVQLKESGETVDSDRESKVMNAITKAGVSENHKIRVVITELEGKPLLNSKTDLEMINTENLDESVKTIIENVKNSTEQVDLSVNDSLLLLEALSSSLISERTKLDSDTLILNTELTAAKARISELETTEKGEMQLKLDEAATNVVTLTEAYKSLLVRFTAVESMRAKRGYAKNRPLEEVIEHLNSRSVESLQDSLNDLFTESVTTPGITVEPVNNPVVSSRTEGSGQAAVTDVTKLLKRLQKPKTESEDSTKTEDAPVEETAPVVTESDDESEDEVCFENGMMIIRKKQKSQD